MAWGGFAVALFLAYLLQSFTEALFPHSIFDAYLVLALLCAFVAPSEDARIGGWLVGLIKDLAGADPLGIHAFTLGLVVLLLTALREAFNVNAVWVRMLVVFLAALPGRFIYNLYLHYWTGLGDAALLALLWQAALTAALAAALVGIIAAAPWFLRSSRRRGGWRPRTMS